MDMNGRITMDLAEYGAEGQVVLGPLKFSRRNEFENSMSDRIRVTAQGKLTMGQVQLGDLNILSTLAYVVEAPFYTGLDKGTRPFLDYMDGLDDKGVDTQALWDAIKENAGRIINGETHPLP